MRLEETESVVEELLVVVRALFLARRAHHDRDQALIAAQGRRRQAETRFAGVAGLDAVDGRIAPQQRVAVVLRDAVPLEVLDRVDLVFVGIIADQRTRQQRDIARGGVVIRIRQAARIDVMRAGHAELSGVLVHQLSERFFGTGRVLGERDRRVVARLDDHAVEQILQRHFAIELQKARRAVGAGAAASATRAR